MSESRGASVGSLVSPVDHRVVTRTILAVCKHVLLLIVIDSCLGSPHDRSLILFFLLATLLLDHLLVSGVALFEALSVAQCVQGVI